MQVINEILSEIKYREESGVLSVYSMRLLLLRSMNHILTKYGSMHDDGVSKCVDELQNDYNLLVGTKMLSQNEVNDIKAHMNDCLVRISGCLGKN